jgi:sulfate adenylyltransferase subunit 1 (EFTu-like GTPase family)
MPWYDGQSLLHYHENSHVVDTRFPVQYVVRPKSDEFHDYRGYAGRVAAARSSPVTTYSCCRPA